MPVIDKPKPTKTKTPRAKKPVFDTPPVAPTPPVPAVTSGPVLMTPEMAADILSRNTRNRPVRKSRIDRYAKDMSEGRWLLNGEAIIVSDEDNLMNGQHRLEAVVKAQTPVWIMLSKGIPEAAFATMDAGLTRTAGDVMGMKGVANFNQVAAVVRNVMNYKDGMKINNARTNAEIEAGFEAHPEIEEYVKKVQNLSRMAHSSLVISLCYIADHYGSDNENERNVDGFIHGVTTGIGLTENDARLTYRNKLQAMMSDPSRRPDQSVVWYFTQRALNHYLNGTPIAKLVPGRGETPYFSEIPSAPRATVAEKW